MFSKNDNNRFEGPKSVYNSVLGQNTCNLASERLFEWEWSWRRNNAAAAKNDNDNNTGRCSSEGSTDREEKNHRKTSDNANITTLTLPLPQRQSHSQSQSYQQVFRACLFGLWFSKALFCKFSHDTHRYTEEKMYMNINLMILHIILSINTYMNEIYYYLDNYYILYSTNNVWTWMGLEPEHLLPIITFTLFKNI